MHPELLLVLSSISSPRTAASISPGQHFTNAQPLHTLDLLELTLKRWSPATCFWESSPIILMYNKAWEPQSWTFSTVLWKSFILKGFFYFRTGFNILSVSSFPATYSHRHFWEQFTYITQDYSLYTVLPQPLSPSRWSAVSHQYSQSLAQAYISKRWLLHQNTESDSLQTTRLMRKWDWPDCWTSWGYQQRV